MNIAVVSDFVPGIVSGVARFSSSIAEQLERRNMKIDVYDLSTIEAMKAKWYDKYLVDQRRNLHLGNAAWEKISASNSGTDVLIQNGISGWNLRNKSNIPRIVIFHNSMRGMYHCKLPPGVPWRTYLNRYIGSNLMKGGLEQYTATGAISVAVSNAVADELRQYYSGIKPVVIPNGIDVTHFTKRDRACSRQKYGIDLDEFVVCFTGRFAMLGKGFAELYAIALLAWEETLQIKFLIATDEIPQGWPPNVIFVHNANYENMPEIYSAADVFVFPSRYEGCSYSLLEAMSCELPVLAGRVGYAKDLHQNIKEIAPFIFEENNVGLYWKSLKQLAGDKSLARRLGVIGSEYVRHHNSMGGMVDSYEKLIRQVAKGDFLL